MILIYSVIFIFIGVVLGILSNRIKWLDNASVAVIMGISILWGIKFGPWAIATFLELVYGYSLSKNKGWFKPLSEDEIKIKIKERLEFDEKQKLEDMSSAAQDLDSSKIWFYGSLAVTFIMLPSDLQFKNDNHLIAFLVPSFFSIILGLNFLYIRYKSLYGRKSKVVKIFDGIGWALGLSMFAGFIYIINN